MSARRRGGYTRLPPQSSDDESEEDCVPQVSHSRSPLRTAITSVGLLVLGSVLLVLCALHAQGSLGYHTSDGAGWGLFALGIISLLPGIHGTSMLYRVWAGQEKWEDLSW